MAIKDRGYCDKLKERRKELETKEASLQDYEDGVDMKPALSSEEAADLEMIKQELKYNCDCMRIKILKMGMSKEGKGVYMKVKVSLKRLGGSEVLVIMRVRLKWLMDQFETSDVDDPRIRRWFRNQAEALDRRLLDGSEVSLVFYSGRGWKRVNQKGNQAQLIE